LIECHEIFVIEGHISCSDEDHARRRREVQPEGGGAVIEGGGGGGGARRGGVYRGEGPPAPAGCPPALAASRSGRTRTTLLQ